MTINGRIYIELDHDEKAVLRAGLLDWGGPARPTDAIAVAMGFSNAQCLPSEAWALWGDVDADSSLTAKDWRRAILALEIAFASDIVGSGVDWSSTSGFGDEETIRVLRRLQRKVLHRIAGA